MSNFFKRLLDFRIGRIIKSYDLIIPLVISVIGVFTFFSKLTPLETRQELLSDLMLSSISITTIVLAGFAIVLSLTEKEFVKYLKEYGIYDNIIFTFEYTAILSLTTFVISAISKYLFYNQYFYYFNLFLMIYLIAVLMQLIMFITTFGVKKGELYG